MHITVTCCKLNPYLFLQHADCWLLLPARPWVWAGRDEAMVTRSRTRLPQQRWKSSKDVRPHVLLSLLESGQQSGADGGVEGEEEVPAGVDQRLQTLDGGAPHLPAHIIVVTVLIVRLWMESWERGAVISCWKKMNKSSYATQKSSWIHSLLHHHYFVSHLSLLWISTD